MIHALDEPTCINSGDLVRVNKRYVSVSLWSDRSYLGTKTGKFFDEEVAVVITICRVNDVGRSDVLLLTSASNLGWLEDVYVVLA